jgi:hypothetical protein
LFECFLWSIRQIFTNIEKYRFYNESELETLNIYNQLLKKERFGGIIHLYLDIFMVPSQASLAAHPRIPTTFASWRGHEAASIGSRLYGVGERQLNGYKHKG